MLSADTLPARPVGRYTRTAMAGHSLLLMLLLPSVVSAEAVSIVLMAFLVVWLALSQWRIKRGFLPLVAPFVVLLMIGALGAGQHPLFDVIKDVWYVGKVVVAIGAGYLLARYLRDFASICRIVIMAAVIAAAFHFVEIGMHLRSGASLFDLRREGVRGYFVTVIGLALMVAFSRVDNGIRISRSVYFFLVLFCMGSLIASLSRTYLIAWLLLGGIFKGWGRLTIKNVLRLIVVAGLVGMVILLMAQTDDSGEKSLTKFVNAPSEVTPQEYDNMRDLNLHWRGFETYRALLDFQGGNAFQQVLGQGLGATVDLGFAMNLGGTELRYIPVLHNGYMYVLVKFGLVGLLVYLYFVVRIIKLGSGKGSNVARVPDESNVQRFSAGLGWSLLLTTFVVAGAFNKSTMVPVLILVGTAAAWINRQERGRSQHGTS